VAPSASTTPTIGALGAGTLVVAVVVVGLVCRILVVTGIAIRIGSIVATLLAATAAASPTSTAAPSCSRSLGLIVIGIGHVFFVVIVVVIDVTDVTDVIDNGLVLDRLRGNEQRQVLGAFGVGLRGGLEDQPRLRLVPIDATVRRFRLVGAGQRLSHALGFVVPDGRVRASGPTVQLRQRIDDSLAGGAQHPRQRMDSQPLGLVLFSLSLI
jgi:hypothetical protein